VCVIGQPTSAKDSYQQQRETTSASAASPAFTMSYDYEALVQEFWTARQQAAASAAAAVAETESPADNKRPHLVQAIQAAETLSGHCPMTPLLWIQYAGALGELVGNGKSTETVEGESSSSSISSIEYMTLQLGLVEFPGSLLLHLRAAHVAPAEEQQDCYEKAIEAVGGGSYRNKDEFVVRFYRQLASRTGEARIFLQRSRCPMRQQNETLINEFQSFAAEKMMDNAAEMVLSMEEGRKWEAKVLRQLATHEDSVDAAYHTQGLPSIPVNDDDQSIDWIALMEDKALGMGLGGAELASSFIRYAKAVQRVRGEKGSFDPQELSVAVYERAIAECPTSEPLWLAYLSDLRRFRNGIDRMASVTERAVRNCPYSLALAQERIHAMEYLAAESKIVIAPDDLLKLAKECLDRKFLPSTGAARELYLAVLQVMKRRIMYLLAHQDHQGQAADTKKNKRKRLLRYDDEEAVKKSGGGREKQLPLDDTIREEIEDLIEDIRETYEDIAAFLESSPYDKACILKDRAWSEAMFLSPLEKALESENSTPGSPVNLGLWDQALAAHKPPIPDTTRLYIEQYAAQRPVSSSRDVLTRIRNIRFLYSQAFGKVTTARDADGDHASSLRVLGSLWLFWEKCFGSQRSFVKAQQAIGNTGSEDEEDQKKHALDDQDDTKEAKRIKVEEGNIETDVSGVTTIDANQSGIAPIPSKAVHDFTVRVLKLSTATTDMDLIDTFRPRCGPIVHARIVRHKDGNSKGWGLVQFEDRDSVAKALELNEILGIQGKTIVVERSHMPAAPLIPPGMHRVAAKGEGKASKRNEKRKQKITIK
jgi:RNA recognition motif. (a.k.a. RRM, RBD, or RNP domain)